jgi:phospholipid/cholesterol/gamma-HCH transport system ATP-binding protein
MVFLPFSLPQSIIEGAMGRNQPDTIRRTEAAPAIRVHNLQVSFGKTTVLDQLDMDVRRGEILGVVGASGTGKTVLMRAILGLVNKQQGSVEMLGAPFCTLTGRERERISRRIGVLFQHGALFSSLNVRQNIQVPMREFLQLPQDLMDDLAALRLSLVGLDQSAAEKSPSELSGGMIKRVALARALALDPDIVFLDEPTSGLDPIGAAEFDDLIVHLRNSLGLTVFMVTHDLDSLFSVCDRIAVLGDKKVLTVGTIDEVKAFDHPWVKEYFLQGRAKNRRSY